MKTLFAFLAFCSLAAAEQTTGNYIVQYSGSLTAQTEAITVHLPAAQTRARVKFGKAYIKSATACDFQTERDGTAPTTTTLAPVKLNSYEPTAVFEAYRSSNVGTATRLHTPLPAQTERVIELGKEDLAPGENLTIRVTSACTTTSYTISIEVIQQTN